MKILKDSIFIQNLFEILYFIKNDSPRAAQKFEKELKDKFQVLKQNPYMYKQSIYFEDESYRDLIHKGYTIIYKIKKEKILILEIFKWQDR